MCTHLVPPSVRPVAGRPKRLGGNLSIAADLGFHWQPVRGPNPCRHLETATGTVRLVLSDAVLCGLTRDNARRCLASCCPASANISALIGKLSGMIDLQRRHPRHILDITLRPRRDPSVPDSSAASRLCHPARLASDWRSRPRQPGAPASPQPARGPQHTLTSHFRDRRCCGGVESSLSNPAGSLPGRRQSTLIRSASRRRLCSRTIDRPAHRRARHREQLAQIGDRILARPVHPLQLTPLLR